MNVLDLIVVLVSAWAASYVALALVRLTVEGVTHFTRWALDRLASSRENRRVVIA